MKLFAAIALVTVMTVPAIASADEPSAAIQVKTLKPVTIVGRLNKPSVVIEITRPTAAHEAGAAHESLRASIAR